MWYNRPAERAHSQQSSADCANCRGSFSHLFRQWDSFRAYGNFLWFCCRNVRVCAPWNRRRRRKIDDRSGGMDGVVQPLLDNVNRSRNWSSMGNCGAYAAKRTFKQDKRGKSLRALKAASGRHKRTAAGGRYTFRHMSCSCQLVNIGKILGGSVRNGQTICFYDWSVFLWSDYR